MSGLFSKKHFGSIFTLFFCRSIHYLRAHPQTYLNTVNGLYRTDVNYLRLISAPQWLRGWWGGSLGLLAVISVTPMETTC